MDSTRTIYDYLLPEKIAPNHEGIWRNLLGFSQVFGFDLGADQPIVLQPPRTGTASESRFGFYPHMNNPNGFIGLMMTDPSIDPLADGVFNATLFDNFIQACQQYHIPAPSDTFTRQLYLIVIAAHTSQVLVLQEQILLRYRDQVGNISIFVLPEEGTIATPIPSFYLKTKQGQIQLARDRDYFSMNVRGQLLTTMHFVPLRGADGQILLNEKEAIYLGDTYATFAQRLDWIMYFAVTANMSPNPLLTRENTQRQNPVVYLFSDTYYEHIGGENRQIFFVYARPGKILNLTFCSLVLPIMEYLHLNNPIGHAVPVEKSKTFCEDTSQVIQMNTSRAKIVLISDTSVEKVALGEALKMSQKIDVFEAAFLAYPATTHILSPGYQIYRGEEAQEKLREIKFRPEQLPVMGAADPVRKYFGLGEGLSVVECIRDGVAGSIVAKSSFFRVA